MEWISDSFLQPTPNVDDLLTCSRKRDLAALSKTALSTDFSHSSNGGAKRGSQANATNTRRKHITS